MSDRNPPIDDAELIRRSLAGETGAFGGLVARYQTRLYHSLLQVLGSEEEAQDIAQDAMIQAFRRLDSFRGNSGFYTWLFRIGRNLAISRLRQRRPVQSLHQASGTPLPIAVNEAGPEEELRSREAVEQLRGALAELPEEQRTILVLREFDGLDYDAIAEVLEIPVGTVRSRLHRARHQLKEVLESRGAGPD